MNWRIGHTSIERNITIDFAVRNIGSDDDITVYLGNDDGTYGNRTDYFIGQEPIMIFSGDFNNDLALDIVATNHYTNNMSFLYGYGNGTFREAQNYYVGHTTCGLFPYDFNKDGNLDLAMANLNHDNMSVLLGNGDGTFTRFYEHETGNGPYRVLGEDFNHDFNIDLAITLAYDEAVSIFLGDGDGSFEYFRDFTVLTNPLDMEIGDFNNDGNMDIITGGVGSHEVSYLQGFGNGSFELFGRSVGDDVYDLTSGDYNEDGNLDLAFALWIDFFRTMRVIFGDGNGSFEGPQDYTCGTFPSTILSADFDNDKHIDLGVVCGSDDNVELFFGDGTGAFHVRIAYPVGRSPRWLITGYFRDFSPYPPTIDGPVTGKVGRKYTYTLQSSDPKDDDIFYYVDWGDGKFEEWIGPYHSGEEVIVSHRWWEQGNYSIKVKVRDIYDIESGWATLEVSMPKTNLLKNYVSFSKISSKIEKNLNSC